MNTDQIENAVRKFSNEDFGVFSRWFDGFRVERLKTLGKMPWTDAKSKDEIAAKRHQLLEEVNEFRAQIFWNSGIQPDSTEIIRAMRDGV